MNLPGVYQTATKNGKPSYRASITVRGKHISLGSYSAARAAHLAYQAARALLTDMETDLASYTADNPLPFEKFVSLVNLRDHDLYFANPIYLGKSFFTYYLSPELALKFDLDDLFYYASHKIMRREGHLFISDYGSQLSLPARYGIRSYAVEGRDYRFLNQDHYDFRYENLEIINPYFGVRKLIQDHITRYEARIHVNGYLRIGIYSSETDAAIAYNKAADVLHAKGVSRRYAVNYVDQLPASAYAERYHSLKISDRILSYPASC